MLSFGGKVALKNQTEVRQRTDYDNLYKLVLVGDHLAGKSCLLVRFSDSRFFSENYITTIGVEFMCKIMEVNGKMIKAQCWDTTGQERFRSITSSYYRGAHGLILFYDITNRSSFQNVRKWRNETQNWASEEVAYILVATKSDCESKREVTTEEGRELANELNMPFIETSAKNDINVTEAFQLLVGTILDKQGTKSEPHMAQPRASTSSAPPATELSFASISSKITSFFNSVINPAPANAYKDNNNDDDNESFSESELEDTMAGSTSTTKNNDKGKLKEKSSDKGEKHVHQKTDVNVFKLDLSKLTADGQLMTGDPSFCVKCAVTLNHISKVKVIKTEELKSQNALLYTKKQPIAYCGVRDLFFVPQGYVPSDMSSITTTTTTTTTATSPPSEPSSSSSSSSDSRDTQNYDNLPLEVSVWTCEFCGFHNLVQMAEEELPHSETFDYVIKPASTNSETDESSQNLIFCIDISGSMCVTTEVTETSEALRHALNSTSDINNTSDAAARKHAMGAGDQKLPGEKRGVKYVSRLQCVQAAIEQHISHIQKSNPNNKIGLITFNNEVTVIGDGVQEPLVVAGDKLDSFQELKEIGERYRIEKTVQDAEKDLIKKLWALQESECTALGPALLLSILIAGSKPASKVILCTDGLANFGIGGMDGERAAEFTPFYTELAEIAYLKGVTVSIISIAAEDCSLENLSVVTERTRGEVERVDPRNIAKNFQSILTNPIIATGCMATIFLHKGLMFKNEIDDEFEADENLLRKDLGNVTAETECTFSYGFRPKTQIDLSDIQEVPFQVQLVYTKLNGMQCLRVATASIQLTEDRKIAEKGANITVIGTHAAQRAAKYAKDGEFERAQMETRAAQRFMNRNVGDDSERSKQVSVWTSNVLCMDDALRGAKKKEESEGGEREEGEKKKEARKRGLRQNDGAAVAITKAKVANSNALFM